MKKIERLQKLSLSEAEVFLTGLVGEDKAKLFFEEEQTTVKLKDVQVGSFIKYGGIEWVVLDKSEADALVLSKSCLFNKAFDESNCNNWETSSLRKAMNAIDGKGRFKLKEFAGINTDDLVPIRRNLLTDDGMPDYGDCEDKITIYTAEEYRRYRKYIPNAEKWHWTITGDSLVCSGCVRFVHSGGALYCDSAYGGNGGVRPLCILKSEILVELCGG